MKILTIAPEKAGDAIAVRYDEGLVRANDSVWAVGDASLFRRETGWEPVYALEDTLGWMME